jgi:hypothetical protein
MPIVLTSNEKILSGHDWKDREGEQYHFPNQYRNKIISGETFVYYRGVHRADGKRGEMEYFGVGTIGEIWLDPDTEEQGAQKRNWYCAIDDYVPFSTLVLAKHGDDTIETAKHSNHWRTAVREISDEQYEEVLRQAKLTTAFERRDKVKGVIEEKVVNRSAPVLGEVKKAKKKVKSKSSGQAGNRYSKKSKLIGDAGEKVVLKYLETSIPGISNLKWLANEGETPGWDIEYTDQTGDLQRIEVKSSESKNITSIEMTANEWRAAEAHRADYQLALVGACLSDSPVIEFVCDPAGLAGNGELEVEPSRYEISWRTLE